jgi:hypothetical protein
MSREKLERAARIALLTWAVLLSAIGLITSYHLLGIHGSSAIRYAVEMAAIALAALTTATMARRRTRPAAAAAVAIQLGLTLVWHLGRAASGGQLALSDILLAFPALAAWCAWRARA